MFSLSTNVFDELQSFIKILMLNTIVLITSERWKYSAHLDDCERISTKLQSIKNQLNENIILYIDNIYEVQQVYSLLLDSWINCPNITKKM